MNSTVIAFTAYLLVTVGWPGLTWQKVVEDNRRRVKLLLRVHSVMIAALAFWGVTIGFNWQRGSAEIIEQQRETIQNLATGRNNSTGENHAGMAQQIAHQGNELFGTTDHKTYEVTTPGGIKVSWNASESTNNSMLHRFAGHDKRGGDDRSGRIDGRPGRGNDRYRNGTTPGGNRAIYGVHGLAGLSGTDF